MPHKPRPDMRHTRSVREYTRTKGHMNRHVRLRYVTVEEHLAQAMETRRRQGNLNKPCPICDFWEAHIGEDVRDVEKLMLSDPNWGAMSCCETLKNTTHYNNKSTHPHGEAIAREVQHDAALALVEYHPWERARGPLENLFRDKATQFVSREALEILVDFIMRNHPNPMAFLTQNGVAAKIPPDMDLEILARRAKAG